jgi:hypothetical protein
VNPFTGDEFISWLQENVQRLGGSFELAEEAAEDLTGKGGPLRRLGELGKTWMMRGYNSVSR